MLAFLLCLFCATAVQGYEAETLWMQVVCLSGGGSFPKFYLFLTPCLMLGDTHLID